jgi:acyl carrier protein
MEEAAIYDKLTTVFHEVFGEPDLVLRPDLIAEDVDGWDSLTHVRLVLAVSKAFAVRFSAAEVGDLKNIGEFVALIRTKA